MTRTREQVLANELKHWEARERATQERADTVARRQAAEGRVPRHYRGFHESLERVVAEEIEQAEVPEAVNLLEELAVMRAFAQRAVDVHRVAWNSETATEQARVVADALLVDSMQQVAAMCEKTAKVFSLTSDRFTVASLRGILVQVVACVTRVYGADERVDELVAELRGIRLQRGSEVLLGDLSEDLVGDAARATMIAPNGEAIIDAEVVGMDATIPDNPETTPENT